jgi:hypothetical protein
LIPLGIAVAVKLIPKDVLEESRRLALNLPRTHGHMVKQYLEGVREGNGRHEEEV